MYICMYIYSYMSTAFCSCLALGTRTSSPVECTKFLDFSKDNSSTFTWKTVFKDFFVFFLIFVFSSFQIPKQMSNRPINGSESKREHWQNNGYHFVTFCAITWCTVTTLAYCKRIGPSWCSANHFNHQNAILQIFLRQHCVKTAHIWQTTCPHQGLNPHIFL